MVWFHLMISSALFFLHCRCDSRQPYDSFHEELFIKNLPGGHVYTHFQFTTTWNMTPGAENAFNHFHLFPKSFGEILHKFAARELHLSLTQGRWRHELWGYPVNDAAPGAELWVWFSEAQNNIDAVWTDLVNVLSGIFCASLNFMDLKTAISPKFGFRPKGVTTANYNQWFNTHVRYAVLPRENVCTENLTPWKKLLPCGTKAGMSTLLNAAKLYETSYNSLAIDFRPVCLDERCQYIGVEISQSVSIVFDPIVMSYNIGSMERWNWSMKKMFGRIITSACPLASTSTIYVDIGSNCTKFDLSPEPHSVLEAQRGAGDNSVPVRYAVYDISRTSSSQRTVNVEVKYTEPLDTSNVVPPTLTAHRFQTGQGRITGGVVCFVHNNHPTKDIVVVYQEIMPWFTRMYFHTLKIETFPSLPERTDLNGKLLKPIAQHYVPGRDRLQSYQLEVVLQLPANSVTRLSFEFERQLLKWTEYPPDANHGFYIGSAVLSAILPDARNITSPDQNCSILASIFESPGAVVKGYFVRLHTEPLLVTLPTPDFSMPYNVICLACTVLAIAFGSIHNLTTRRFVVYDPSKRRRMLAKVQHVVGVVYSKLRLIRRRDSVADTPLQCVLNSDLTIPQAVQ